MKLLNNILKLLKLKYKIYKLEDYRFIIKKKVKGNSYYLRYCSTTGEPLWEDRITRNTETFFDNKSAKHTIKNYFISGIMNKCVVEPILKSTFPPPYDVNTQCYYGLNQ